MTQSQRFQEWQPGDVRRVPKADRDQLIVSTINIEGNSHILSRYGDAVWKLPSTTTNVEAGNKGLNFETFPEEFAAAMKAITYRYLFRGREGQVRPSLGTLISFHSYGGVFLRFLKEMKITRLADVTPLVCKMYVDHAKATFSSRGKPIRPGTLVLRFLMVEAIYELSQYTDDPMKMAPWPDATACSLSGMNGTTRHDTVSKGRTTLIPDHVFVAIFNAAWAEVTLAPTLLDLRDELDDDVALKLQSQGQPAINAAMTRHLHMRHWKGDLASFRSALLGVRAACYAVVASLSGCRHHEIAFIQTNACYRTEDDDGETYWWMKSRSTKTGEGLCEWMVPEAAVTALGVMDRWAAPYTAAIDMEIDQRRNLNPADPQIAQALRHRNAVFVGADNNAMAGARTVSSSTCNIELNRLLARHNIDWKIATHQFRRKFANYAARSQFGDLRYLRDHFKHWSMDMSLGYALNESQEMSLFHEIQGELDVLKDDIVEQWFQPNEPLAGGYGQNIVEWREGRDVTLFKDRATMIRTISESTAIRSNGHAWCTADDNKCVGNGGLETTRCTGCDNAVIGRVHEKLYQGLYDHLKEVLKCGDIGSAGLARVKRDLDRCREVLVSLGFRTLEPST